MGEDSKVSYSNHIYAFIKFQEQYKNLCQEISESKRNAVRSNIKKVKSFVFEYLSYSNSSDFRIAINKSLDALNTELSNDKEFQKLVDLTKREMSQKISYNQKYYYYLIKIFKIVGIFGDELGKTFMPSRMDQQRLFKFWNGNPFYEQFTYYKSNTSQKLSNFKLTKFRETFPDLLGFYFAYYLFIDPKSRILTEKVFSNILSIVLSDNALKLIIEKYSELSPDKKLQLKKLDYLVHDGLSNIFFRCNYSYSQFGVMPKKYEKVLTDRTAI